MKTLHFVFNGSGLRSCQNLKSSEDLVVLMGDGTYYLEFDQDDLEIENTYTLEEDYSARGLNKSKTINLISYDEVVELCVRCSPIVSWHE